MNAQSLCSVALKTEAVHCYEHYEHVETSKPTPCSNNPQDCHCNIIATLQTFHFTYVSDTTQAEKEHFTPPDYLRLLALNGHRSRPYAGSTSSYKAHHKCLVSPMPDTSPPMSLFPALITLTLCEENAYKINPTMQFSPVSYHFLTSEPTVFPRIMLLYTLDLSLL